MARTTATMSDRIIGHFMTVDMATAEEDFRVVKQIIQSRVAARDEKAMGNGKHKPKAKSKPKAKTTSKPGASMVSMAATTDN